MKKQNRMVIEIAIFVIILIFPPKELFKKDIKNTIEQPSITLFRILGNDLPPLHSFDQTITNLLFILRNESFFPSLSKIWILNRIVNKDKEKILIDILNQYKQYYLRIPFIWDDYRQIPFYFPKDYPKDEFFNSTHFNQLTPRLKLKLIDMLYYKKNLYAINSNGARNFALRHGKQESRSDWLMIFDGNCFLSQQSYDLIRQSLLINGSRFQYFIVPTIRLLNNSDIYHLNITEKKEEPEIIFRRNSTIEYSELIPFGQQSKMELLSYLGVINLSRKAFEWVPKERISIAADLNITSNLFQKTSFILRLFLGTNQVNPKSMHEMACTRYEGVIVFLKSLDYQIIRRRVLPRLPISTSPRCILWSDDEIRKGIEIVRQRMNMTNVI